MHSQSTNWTRNAILVLAPLTLIALLAVFVGPAVFGSNKEDSTKLASANFSTEGQSPSTSATTSPAAEASPEPSVTAAAAAPKVKDLGTVKGAYTIRGPKKVAAGSLVVFVVDGKKRLVVKDEKAPYALKLKTRSLPNGAYTVNVLTSKAGKSATVSTYTLKVNNTKKKPTAKPTTTASPGSTPKPDPSTPADKPTTTAPSTGGGSTDSSRAGKVLEITNAKRADAGCKPLKLNAKLNKAAQGHSADMAAKDYFSHDSQDGRSPFDRMSDAGYNFGAAAENIAMGQQTPADVMNSWMNSAGHKANILNCTYTEMGLGYAVGNGSPYWTQVFGKPL